jgi:micrococcal nuclease
MYEYPVRVLEIHDGDTLKLDIDLGLRIHCVDKIRLAHVDAPELMTLPGVQAKAFVVRELADLIEAKIFTTRQEKYGRWLAEFRYRVQREPTVWRDLGSVLLREGHAVKYRHR